MAWFTSADLKALYPYQKVQSALDAYVDNVLIPEAVTFVQNYTLYTWDDDSVPDDILIVTRNYAVNKILADDETVRIAQARGQSSTTIAGDTMVLDLSPGRNPFLSAEDEATLIKYRNNKVNALHVDKVTVRANGARYRSSVGRNTPETVDYVREDEPLYPSGPLRP